MLNKLGIGKKAVFKHPSGRIIYYDYLTNRAYTIPPEKQQQFPLYQNRYLVSLLVVALALVFEVPVWICLVGGLAVAIGFEIFFRKRYLPSFTYTERFNIEEAINMEKKVDKESFKKTLLRIVVYSAFAIVLVLNAYDMEMSQTAVLACWAISAVVAVLVIKMIIDLVLNRKEK